MSSGRADRPEVRVFAGPESLARAAAEEVLVALGDALGRRSRASWVLPGGSTPRRLYERLASQPEALDWARVELFWTDERCVAPRSPASNFALVRDTLLAKLPLAPDRVHRLRGELPPAEAARLYAAEVAAELERGPFDLVLLGLGADGHTASLFPGPGPVPDGLAAAVKAPFEPRRRVTLTPAALANNRRLVYLVAGRNKAAAVARALDPDHRAEVVSDRIVPRGGTLWLLDREAAAGLSRSRER